MIVCYIAGAYSADAQYKVKQNIYLAEALGMEVVERFGKQGATVIIPHCNTSHWEQIQSDEWFYEATMELLKRSDVCIYVPGDVERSVGTRKEFEYCHKVGKPCFPGDEEGFKEFQEWLNLRLLT